MEIAPCQDVQEGREQLKLIQILLLNKRFTEKTCNPPRSLEGVAYDIAWNINHSARPNNWGPVPKEDCKVQPTFGYLKEMVVIGLVDEKGYLTEDAKEMYRKLHAWYIWDDQLL